MMSSDHSLPFSIRVMRNENFGLALQETSRNGPLKLVKEPEWLMQTGTQGLGAALGGSTFRRELLLLQVNRSTHQACHVSMPLRQRESVGEGAVPNPLGVQS
jgi:hypothetical protein